MLTKKPEVLPLNAEERAQIDAAALEAEKKDTAPPWEVPATATSEKVTRSDGTPPGSGSTTATFNATQDLRQLLLVMYGCLLTLIDRERVSREELQAAYQVACESYAILNNPPAGEAPPTEPAAQPAAPTKESA